MAARRIGRHAHHIVAWLGSLAGVLILVVAVAIWRLMQGPIELDSLIPYVEAGFARSGIGAGVTVKGVRFGLDRHTHELHLWAEGAQVTLPNGERVASLPELATSFSIGSLLRGEIAPTQVSIERPVVHLKRHEGGGFTFRIGDLNEGAPDLGPQNLDQLLPADPHGGSGLGSLRRVRLQGATVIVDDKNTGRRWRATNVDAAIERGPGGIAGDVSLAVPLGAGSAELHGDFRYDPAQQKADVGLAVNGLDPVMLPPLFPELRPLGQIHSVVSGTLTTRLDLRAGRSEGMRLDLGLAPGHLDGAALPGGRVDIASGELHAVYAPEKAELRLATASFDLGDGTALRLAGAVQGVTPETLAGGVPAPGILPGKFDLTLSHVPVARLDKFWPAGVSAGGRRWAVANIHEGVLDEASVQVALNIDAASQQANFLSAQGSLRYHDVTVTYFNGLPPARKVAGTATFSEKRAEFTPTGGQVKDLKLTGGSLVITEIGSPVEWLTTDLNISGPVQQALEVLDSKPLHYAHAVGLEPSRVGGHTEAQVHFKFPLLADLKIDQMEYAAKATLTGASIAKALMDHDLTDGALSLEIAHTGLRLKGNAKFDAVPLTLDGEMPFRAGPTHARYRVVTRLDDVARRRLDIDFAPDQLSGPVGVDVTYTAAGTATVTGAGGGEATATLDLHDAALQIPEAGWKKPAGAPAQAKLVFVIENGAIVRLPQVEARAGGLDARLALMMAPDHRQIDRVDIKHLALGETEVAGTVTRRSGGGWRADLRGLRLDASRVLKQDTTSGEAAPPLAISGRFDRVMLGGKRELRNVSLQMLRNAGVWQSVQLESRLPNGQRLAAQVGGPAEPGSAARRLMVESDDFGATLSLFDVTNNIVGGHLTVNGQIVEAGGKRTIAGRLEATDYSFVRAPAFAQVLGMASLNGLASALSGQGVPFTTLRAEFTYTPARVSLARLVAYGASIGVTANGWFDLDRDSIELQGTLAPAYALNSMPGIVPVIGSLLTGGEGQGLFAANYRLSGPSDNPQVSVNPLSALAPGFLRKLFEFGLPQPQPAARAQPQAQQQQQSGGQ